MTDDFSDPANWHPIEEHPYLNDPPKVTPIPGMADTLRTRIAAALKEARIVSYWREGIDEADGQPYRSLVIRSDEQAAEYAADAVIRELGPLVRYWDKDFNELHYCRECGGWGPKDD